MGIIVVENTILLKVVDDTDHEMLLIYIFKSFKEIIVYTIISMV